MKLPYFIVKRSKYKFLTIGVCAVLIICIILIFSAYIILKTPVHIPPDATDISASDSNSGDKSLDILSKFPVSNKPKCLEIPQKFYEIVSKSPEVLVALIPEDIRADAVTKLSDDELLRIACRVIQISNVSVPEQLLTADGSGYDIPLSEIVTILDHILLNYHAENLLKSPQYNHKDQTIYIDSSCFDECSDKLETLGLKVIKRLPYDGMLTAELVLNANSMEYHNEKVSEFEVLVTNTETNHTYERAAQIVIMGETPKLASIVTIQN